MIPNSKLRVVESHGITSSAVFGISLKDSAHIMTILRDTLYSDKVLAVIREYSSNAWDAHREVGKADVPIKVTLPTSMDQNLVIEDFGPGLSPEDVFEVYTQYGASTKRDNNSTVGCLGIGSKSGFAYSDSFTVTSRHGGKKCTYVAVLDESEKGAINLLHEEPCGPETGVSVQIAIRPEDIEEFHQKAKKLFQFFIPRPEINTELPSLPAFQVEIQNGVIYDDPRDPGKNHAFDYTGWVAIMGCVSYRINLDQLGEQIPRFIHDIAGALYFKMGEVQISASREELKYSAGTKGALIAKLNSLVEEYVQQTLHSIETSGITVWEKRLRAQVFRQMGLPVPKKCEGLTDASAKLPYVPEHFTVMQARAVATTISIDGGCRFLLRDDTRPLLGYNLKGHDYVIRQANGASWVEVEKELNELLKAAELTGVPILKMSGLFWATPTTTLSGKTINVKHKINTFHLDPARLFVPPWSRNWVSEKGREPQDDDVYVTIDGFRSIGFDIFLDYREDEILAKMFGAEMPTIYAYKCTEKNPDLPKNLKGTPYREWHQEFAKSLLTPKVMKPLSEWEWANAIADTWYWRYQKTTIVLDALKVVGDTHPLSTFILHHLDGKKVIENWKTEFSHAIQILHKRLESPDNKTLIDLELETLRAKYPLLARHGFCELWGDHKEEWQHYVHLVDNAV
jgi:hypothetical protein